MKKIKLSKNKKRLILTVLILIVLGITYAFSIDFYIKASTKDRILSPSEVTEYNADCIIVLGAKVTNDQPSIILADRLKRGIEVYELGAAPKMLMSGDHGREEYDEVNAMKNYAIERDVPSADIFMDHAGFSTYDSIYRAKEIFGAKKIIIVSQSYHLHRAIFIADKLGIEAVGVSSDLQEYSRQSQYDAREVIARNKDFLSTIFKPKPKYLGEAISVSGNGNVTNDNKN